MPGRAGLLARCLVVRRARQGDALEGVARHAAGAPMESHGLAETAWQARLRDLQRGLVRLRRERTAKARA